MTQDNIFPNPCCRCGYCCLHETCPVACDVFGIDKATPCLALRFEGDFTVDPETLKAVPVLPHFAVCLLAQEAPEIMGIGVGCCIKATCYRGGVAYDFAALPPALKHHVAALKKAGDSRLR